MSGNTANPPLVPIIDIEPLLRCRRQAGRDTVARQIDAACRTCGFFYVRGHGVDETLQDRLHRLSQDFFRLPEEKKMEIAMARAGRAWRGYFPLGQELTSGKPDIKEGIYFGAELSADHPEVRRGLPLHGANLFPAQIPPLREVVLRYLTAMTSLGHVLMEGLSLALGLPENYFAEHYTGDPLILFRIFNYPPPRAVHAPEEAWGVGEHTDYGVLTILKQDESGGLEVKTPTGWVAAPPIAGTFVCNIGDMLDRLTGGAYRSTPHRVRNPGGAARLSYPFFFDPGFEVQVKRLPHTGPATEATDRWDRANPHAFEGTYGEYLLNKVGKVFPELHRRAL